ncbi:SixA phosphatase family protein [Shewanella ulleungensis]|jgi:broad specificity phosphatase PhoE|uniref:SixA phosphatase family protein n=1 Tax=Shewanella ulleungensis TaxID=2282699 RepID=UPI003D7A83EA
MTSYIRNALTLFLLLLSGSLMAQTANTDMPLQIKNTKAKVFYLVRHAEKLEGKDPSLSAQGKLRAIRLAKVLSSTPLAKVFTTDYKRTRETALAVAEDQHLAPNLYDAADLKKTAEILLKQQGHILVIGHSNTTTALAEQLGAEKQPAINDASEFDRLYVVTVDGNNREVSTVLLRY